MNYKKSAAPYLCLLFAIIFLIPLTEYHLEKEQRIEIEIKTIEKATEEYA